MAPPKNFGVKPGRAAGFTPPSAAFAPTLSASYRVGIQG